MKKKIIEIKVIMKKISSTDYKINKRFYLAEGDESDVVTPQCVNGKNGHPSSY